jgi:hypothetical protein
MRFRVQFKDLTLGMLHKFPCHGISISEASMIQRLKQNLAQAQARIKKYDDGKRSEREFSVGDMIYLRLKPFRQVAFGIHHNLKLTTIFYGPFKIMERIGKVAYKLQLPDSANIHLVFHVSQLKKHLGAKAIPQDNLPLVTDDGYIKTDPMQVLDTRALPRNDDIVTQWNVQWQNLSEDQATWEDKLFVKATFPKFYNKILQEWWPPTASSGQEVTQGGGGHEPEPMPG